MCEPVILSYHDSVLHESECELLAGPHWLNDNLLQFHLDYLQHAAYPGAPVSYVGPDVTQFARLCSDCDLPSFLAPLRLSSAGGRSVLFVLNDCDLPDSPGGTHWSLLVATGGKFIHYDSLGDGNQKTARRLVSRLAPLLGAGNKVQEASCGRQKNGYDCGVFVAVHAEEVTRRLAEGGQSLLHVPVDQQRVDEKRVEMLTIIRRLAAEGGDR